MKKVLIILSTLCAILIVYYFINDVIRANYVFVKETYIQDERLPDTFDGIRIVQFSDALISSESDLTRLENLVSTLEEISPDVLIFTGDLFSSETISEDILRQTENILSSIEAPIAKVAVLGDHDINYADVSIGDQREEKDETLDDAVTENLDTEAEPAGGGMQPNSTEQQFESLDGDLANEEDVTTNTPKEDDVLADHPEVIVENSLAKDVLEASSFTVLQNEIFSIYNGTMEHINIIGLTPLSTQSHLATALFQNQDDTYSIILMHEPTLAPIISNYNVDLQLSGHCLGNSGADDLYQTCSQFTSGTYHFANRLILHVNEGLHAKASRQSMFTQPTIHSFLLLSK